MSYPELYLNPQGTPEAFPSHFHMIPKLSLSTPKYSQVFLSFPSYTRAGPLTSLYPNNMYSPESSSECALRFRNSGPVLFPLHPVHSELTYVRVSELPSTYPLSSSLHSCTFINPFRTFGS